jgi:hypothetical protein
MRYKKTIASVAFLILGLGGLQAQEISVAAGGDASSSGGAVTYSVGQVVYTTNTGTNGSIVQGVQQAYEITVLSVDETELNILLSVFPNPTADMLTLQISDYKNEKLSYQLFDMQGKLLNNGQVNAQQTEINTSLLPAAIYFIHVFSQENEKVQSFKIIKK